MKKILAAAFLFAMALQAGAQSWTDALDFSDNDYLGTARSVGMGNAMTAVGGDLGSITFNPAGSAVASYSQFTITPGLNFSTVTAQGSLVDNATGDIFGFEDKTRTRFGRMGLPNFGVMMAYDTRNRSGLKRVTFGVVGNVTRNYTNWLRAYGTNRNNTLAGSLASQADGWSDEVLSSFDQGDVAWEVVTGYLSGIFGDINGKYVGLTEALGPEGPRNMDNIGQFYGLKRAGSKYDLLMNFGLDFDDRFYLGANLGLVTIDYRSDETRFEEALSGINYDNGFESLRMRYALRDVASGIYMKVGFIARPFDGLRIGAAIQTPTLFDIRETYQYEGQSIAKHEEMRKSSPQDEWLYRLKAPFRANVGIAYTISKMALLSADYEYTDYSGMKFYPAYDDYYNFDFSSQNSDIRDFTGAVHALRLGAEIKPSPELALRVGYNLTTGAQYNKLSFDSYEGALLPTGSRYERSLGEVIPLSAQERKDQLRTAVSFGIGYSSPGSFFADFAVRFQYLPNEMFTPYYYYGYWSDYNGGQKYADGSDPICIMRNDVTPEICSQSALCNALLTLGWRF